MGAAIPVCCYSVKIIEAKQGYHMAKHRSSGILVFLPGVHLVCKRVKHRYGFV